MIALIRSSMTTASLNKENVGVVYYLKRCKMKLEMVDLRVDQYYAHVSKRVVLSS